MVKLKLKGKRYRLPERFTVDQWLQLVKFDYLNPHQWNRVISIAIGVDEDLLIDVDKESKILAISLIINAMNARREYKVRDFNTITFGEFVDLDVYMVLGVEKNLKTIVNMLSDGTEWADEAMWLVDQYSLFRVHMYRSYANLFGLNDPTEDEDEEDLEAYDPNQVVKGWYKIIVDLADNDLLKIDAITDQPLKKALNFMAYKKEKQLEENFKQLQQKRQYDLQRNR
jgi:uncharacterized protein YuzE